MDTIRCVLSDRVVSARVVMVGEIGSRPGRPLEVPYLVEFNGRRVFVYGDPDDEGSVPSVNGPIRVGVPVPARHSGPRLRPNDPRRPRAGKPPSDHSEELAAYRRLCELPYPRLKVYAADGRKLYKAEGPYGANVIVDGSGRIVYQG